MLSRLFALAALSVLPATYGAEHRVTVGGPGLLKYDPEFVVCFIVLFLSLLRCLRGPQTAAPNDTIIFTFKQKNHTTTQSSFESPCTHLEGGFDSGL